MPIVTVIIGSKSDRERMEVCNSTLTDFGIENELEVISAHRTPEKLRSYLMDAPGRGVEVIIAGAGMAAALPGACASMTTLPVIGVPVSASSGVAGGLDSLLAISQMPPGVPVGCMAINGAKNAAIYAARILSLKYKPIQQALEAYQERQAKG